MEYSNPRTEAIFHDWPYGNKRCNCLFYVEASKGKERAVRKTDNPKTGRWNKPKTMTYAYNVCFMDGDDGRIYVMNFTGNAVSIMKSDMKLQHEYIGADDEQYREIIKLYNDMRENELAAANS